MERGRAASILERAVSRGWVGREDVEGRDPEQALRRLIRAGLLSEDAIDALSTEVAAAGARAIDPDRVPTQAWESIVSTEGTPVDPLDPFGTDEQAETPFGRLEPGTEWGHYRIGEFLGSGGMGVVYRALDTKLDRVVALKILRAGEMDFMIRFVREARVQARLRHENVCDVYEAGEHDGVPHIAMQFIDGPELGEIAEELSLEQKVKIIAKVAEAVHAAHREGLIHRDLKPSNILVEPDPVGGLKPYVVDFGLARDERDAGTTATGMMMGTPAYMAPEQAMGESRRVDRRTDVYSLGAVLYRLLTGRPPFQAANQAQYVVALMELEPLPPRKVAPGVPVDLETIVLKCLDKDPDRRYPSARALALDLQRYLDDEPIEARPASVWYRVRKRVRRNRPLYSVIAVAAILVLAFGTSALAVRLRAAQQARLAQQFGRDAQDIEWIMRVAHLCPIHDITREKDQVRARMAEIEGQLDRVGPVAEGAGSYALGLGHLVLDEDREARTHLERAWSLGYREPEVAYALGLTLGAQYEQELLEVEELADADLREARRREVEQTLREPTLEYLRASRGSDVVVPEYLEGLIALYEKRYDDGLVKAAAASSRADWFYEAYLLEAALYAAMAAEHYERDERDPGKHAAESGRRAYRKALEVGQSDPGAHLGLCESWAAQMRVDYYHADDLSEPLAGVDRACGDAMAVDPAMGAAHRAASSALRVFASHQASRGRDSEEVLQRSLDHAQRAVALDPDSELSHEALGLIHFEIADLDWEYGRDAEPHCKLAIESFQRAIELDPTFASSYGWLGDTYRTQAYARWDLGLDPLPPWGAAIESYEQVLAIHPTSTAYADLGNIHSDRSQYVWERGDDPDPDLQAAVENFQRAIELSPSDYFVYGSLGTAYSIEADVLLSRGEDPSAAVQRTIEAMARAAELAPNWDHSYLITGATLHTRAEYERLSGGDPRATLQEAVAQLRKALALNQRSTTVHLYLAYSALIEARYELDQGRSPLAALDGARAHLERALQVDPGDPDTLHSLWEAELLEGRYAVEVGRSPRRALEHSREILADYAEIYPDIPRTLESVAHQCRWEAEWGFRRGEPQPERIAEGLAAVRKAKASSPSPQAPILLAEAALLLQQARLEGVDAATSRAEAEAALERALQLDPLLARDVERLRARPR